MNANSRLGCLFRMFSAKMKKLLTSNNVIHFFIFTVCVNSDMVLDSNNECNCPVDTYQETIQDNTIQCTACPRDSSTGTTTGVQSITDCGKYDIIT